VFLKTYEIRPTDSELSNTRNLTETTESVLTDVINHMNSGDEKIFEGRFRIGDLQKVTMLKGIRKLELLLMCFSRPTQTLLRNLVENVKAKMEEKDVEKKFKVQRHFQLKYFFNTHEWRYKSFFVKAVKNQTMLDL